MLPHRFGPPIDTANGNRIQKVAEFPVPVARGSHYHHDIDQAVYNQKQLRFESQKHLLVAAELVASGLAVESDCDVQQKSHEGQAQDQPDLLVLHKLQEAEGGEQP